MPPKSFDRQRGDGCPPTPGTALCVRICTRRIKSVALTLLEFGVRTIIVQHVAQVPRLSRQCSLSESCPGRFRYSPRTFWRLDRVVAVGGPLEAKCDVTVEPAAERSAGTSGHGARLKIWLRVIHCSETKSQDGNPARFALWSLPICLTHQIQRACLRMILRP